MGSLGKQGEAAGEGGTGNSQFSRPTPHPQAPGCTLGNPAGASRLSLCTHWLATCDTCSITHYV